MGWLGEIVGGLFGTAQQGSQMAFDANQSSLNREFQAKEAEKNRNFQSFEAAAQRDWSSQEAERARDWNEEMYAKYNSLQGKISQAEQAGVNPMLAVTGNASSPVSASSSAPSGASAGSVGTPSGDSASMRFVDIIGQIMGVKKTEAEIDLMKSQEEGNVINNEMLRDMNTAEIMSKLSQVELNDANIELIASKVLNTDADTEVKVAQLGQIASQIKNTEADTDVKIKQLALMTSEIAKNNKSLDVMSAQISEMYSSAGLNDARVSEVNKILDLLTQQYDHNEIVYAFDESIKAMQANDADFWNTSNYSGAKGLVVRLIKEARSFLTFGNK